MGKNIIAKQVSSCLAPEAKSLPGGLARCGIVKYASVLFQGHLKPQRAAKPDSVSFWD